MATPEQQAAQAELAEAQTEEQAASAAFDASTAAIKAALIAMAPYQETLQQAENEHHQTRQRLTQATIDVAAKQAALDALPGA